MAAGHSDRAHASWAASATERNWNCPGSYVLNALVEEDDESEAAAWGTACHEVSEMCLTQGREPIEFVGRIIKTKKHAIEVDEEMSDTSDVYVNYVRGRLAEYRDETGEDAVLMVEQKFMLDAIEPPFDAGGTGDAVLYFPKWELLEIVDLKGGRGVVVEAKGNKQLRTYGLGAMLANQGVKVSKVKSTIVQPRAPHKDGRIRSEEIHVVDLAEWSADLKEAMYRAAQAAADYEKTTGAVSRDEWSKLYVCAGSHCKFCKAKPTCPALEQKTLDAAKVFFDDHDKPHISNTPDKMEPGELAKTLDLLDMIEDWVKAVRSYAHAQAESGTEIPGYILVDKQGRETWVDAERVKANLDMLDLGEDLYLNEPKMRTPKQVRASLKKAGLTDVLEALKDESETPVNGTNLVRADKTARPAVAPKPQQIFDAIE